MALVCIYKCVKLYYKRIDAYIVDSGVLKNCFVCVDQPLYDFIVADLDVPVTLMSGY